MKKYHLAVSTFRVRFKITSVAVTYLASMTWAGSLVAEVLPKVNWGEILKVDSSWFVWGRQVEYETRNILPTQIYSQNSALFASAPKLLFSTDQRSRIATQIPDIVSEEQTAIGLSSKKTLRYEGLNLSVSTKLEYDGFIRFDIELDPIVPTKIYELALAFPLVKSVANKYTRYINYNYNTQRVDMGDLVDSAGFIDKPVYFPFNPAVWIGNEEVGIEWVSETNLHWNLSTPSKAISIIPRVESTDLEVNFIKNSKGHTIDSHITFSFGLFVTPSRPKSRDNYLMTSSQLSFENSGFCTEDVLQFFNWTALPVRFPGLPDVTDGSESLYRNLVKKTHDIGRKFIPYGSLYMLPSTQTDILKNAQEWGAAPTRENVLWRKKLGVEKPILPVTFDSLSIQQFLVDRHLTHNRNYGTDGIYFDGAAPYENAAVKVFGMGFNDSGQPLQYVPMFSHRQFVKLFWEKMKANNPDYLIIHHAPRVPKFATAFIDVVAVGEELHRIFKRKNIRVLKAGLHPNGVVKFQYNTPEHYVPDYTELPKSVAVGMRHHRDGVQYMLLPQVRKFNDDFLKANPRLFSQWSNSALDFASRNKLLLWAARLDLKVLLGQDDFQTSVCE